MPTGCLPNKHKDEEPLTSLQVLRETEQTDRRCYKKCRRCAVGERDGLISSLLFLSCYLADACHPKKPLVH